MTTQKIFFLLIILISFCFRVYGLNWDQGHHLHPDERAIVMFTIPLALPSDFSLFLSPQSSWNPHFFAYGNFPLYFLKITGNAFSMLDPKYSTYEYINLVGRIISVISDIGTLIVLYLLAKKLFNQQTGLIASFLYGISVLPIQLAHFYAVDTLLTFFMLLTLYYIICYQTFPTFKNTLLTGVFLGLSLATKNSAITLCVPLAVVIMSHFFSLLRKPLDNQKVFTMVKNGTSLLTITSIVFVVSEPYALIDFEEFIRQTMQQYSMTKNAFTFPYTLQYVGKIPYIYEVKNIFFYGLGPFLAVTSFYGLVYFFYSLTINKKQWMEKMVLTVFFMTFFVIAGKFAIGFMRYLLPIYPLLSLFGAVLLYRLLSLMQEKIKKLSFVIGSIIVGGLLIWPLSFMTIYTKPNTRVLATEWIHANIPSGANLAIEHWDDSLPLYGQEKYLMITFPLYDPDTQEKWTLMNQKLEEVEYIIIASNRLYVPLQKLTDCTQLPWHHCYLQTAHYYKKLLSGSLGFQKVAEFTVAPTIPFLNIPIDDQKADESFTVYDHPKVLIFKKKSGI